MVKKYDIYVARTLMLSMLVVLICLGLLMTMFGFVDEARSTDETRSFVSILVVVLAELPTRLVETINYITLVGVLIGLGSLSQSSEITILRAAGVSPWRLCVSVGVSAILFFVLVLSFSEIIRLSTPTEDYQQSVDRDRPGFWYREGNLFTSIGSFDRQGNIFEVQQIQIGPDRDVESTTESELGRIDRDLLLFTFEKAVEKSFEPSGVSTKTLTMKEWHPISEPTSLRRRLINEPAELSFSDTVDQIYFLRQEGKSSRFLEISLLNRAFKPLSILSLVMVAVGFVIGPLRETGMGTRIAVGLGVGILLEYFNRMLVPLALLYDIPAIAIVLIPVSLVFLAGFLLIRRVN